MVSQNWKKEVNYIKAEQSIHQEGMTVLNIHTPDIRVPRH
jgi:hypothetical protein